MRQDIKSTLCHAIDQSEHSIYLSIYSITDPDVIALLEKKGTQALSVKVDFDPTASLSLAKLLPSAQVNPIRSKGLMHQKIILLDGATLFLSSANLTLSSLRHHNNLVLGLHHPELATYIQNPTAPSFPFTIAEQPAEIYLLPDPKSHAFHHLIDSINSARKSIRIAMFTLTHPIIAERLIDAVKRGVEVSVAIDNYTARGASKKTVQMLCSQGVKIYLSQGKELLHYKWGWIDESLLITGSANWTKSAFSKNQDFILFLSSLDKKQNRFLRDLWKIIEIESKLLL